MKQVVLSMVVVLMAAGILVGLTVYSFRVIREAKIQMLFGDPITALHFSGDTASP